MKTYTPTRWRSTPRASSPASIWAKWNGITGCATSSTKVEIYAQLANTLFENLFGVKLVATVSETTDILGAFMMAWIAFERELVRLTAPHQKSTRRPVSIEDMLRALGKNARSQKTIIAGCGSCGRSVTKPSMGKQSQGA